MQALCVAWLIHLHNNCAVGLLHCETGVPAVSDAEGMWMVFGHMAGMGVAAWVNAYQLACNINGVWAYTDIKKGRLRIEGPHCSVSVLASFAAHCPAVSTLSPGGARPATEVPALCVPPHVSPPLISSSGIRKCKSTLCTHLDCLP